MIGGGFLLIAALLVQCVPETSPTPDQLERVAEEESDVATLDPPESPLAQS